MPIIKPRTAQKHLVRYITRLYRENYELMFAYGKFIGEPDEYLVNELIAGLAKDKEFQAWWTEHPGSYVPIPNARARRRRPAFAAVPPRDLKGARAARESDR